MGKATNIFLMGKGGVGKSTSAALNAVFLAKKGLKVLVVSLDPAHNQCDIFERDFSDKPVQITPHLSVIEVDQDHWIKQYIKGVHNQIKRTYSYLTAFNLDKYFDVIKYSPGLEEYAQILAFKEIQEKFSQLDFLVFDMPPTALALKFFYLPTLSLIWIEHLLALRQEIIKKRDLITKIKFIKKEFERDKVLNKINEMKEEYQDLKNIFEDPKQTEVKLVLNPDQLSLAESIRIFDGLKGINVSLNQIINNKVQANSDCTTIEQTFADIPMLNFPYSETPLIGLSTLEHFLEKNGDVVQKQLNVCWKAAQTANIAF